MIINHNIMASNALRNMNINSNKASKAMQKLSSGLRINSAADDAAGLAISEKMRGQINGLDQAASNAQDAISLIQTGEGALNETHSILQRMRELAVQSSSDTNKDTDRAQIQGEMDQLATEITRISNDTEFNQKNLLAGGLNDTYQVGANSNQNISLSINAMDAFTLGVAADKTTIVKDTVAGQVSNATFDSNVGAAVVDGATISAVYAHQTANAGSDATAANKTVGGTNKFSFDTGVKENATFTIKFATGNTAGAAFDSTGATLTVTLDKTKNNVTASDVQTLIRSAQTDAHKPTGIDLSQFTVSADGTDKIDATATVNESFALAGGAAPTLAGDKITLSDSGAHTQVIDVTGNTTATTLDVNSGDFKGVHLDFGANTLKDVASGSNVKVKKTTIVAKQASLDAKGAVTSKAVAAAGIDVSTRPAADAAITTINNAIESVSTERAKLGAYQNRLEHTIANLGTSSENLTSAESRIRDVDMAKEMSEYSKNNILSQAAQAMLAQANQQPQQVLQLLR